MKAGRGIYITLMVSLIMHSFLLYHHPFDISADPPEKKDVSVLFHIKKQALLKQDPLKAAPVKREKIIKKAEEPEKPVPAVPAPEPVPRDVVTAEDKVEREQVREEAIEEGMQEKDIVQKEVEEVDQETDIMPKDIEKPLKDETPVYSTYRAEPIDDEHDKITKFRLMVIERIEEAKVYPFAARRNDIEGEVSVRFTILTDGKVNNIEVIPPRKSHKLLERAALDTIRKAAPYIPFPDSLKEDGGIRMKITIAFRMT